MVTTALWLARTDVCTSVLEKVLSYATNEVCSGTQSVANTGEPWLGHRGLERVYFKWLIYRSNPINPVAMTIATDP